MPRKKKKKNNKSKNNKYVDPILLRARNLRSSLLRRIRKHENSEEMKINTPTIDELYKWLNKKTYICRYSRKKLTLAELTIDHRIPLHRGGDNKFENLCFCSREMNDVKGTMTEAEFLSILKIVSKWEDRGKSLFGRLRRGYFK